MHPRLLALAFVLLVSSSCRDSPTKPGAMPGAPPPPSVPVLAAQLRNDPFLRMLAKEAGDPAIADQLNRAFGALADETGAGVAERALANARTMLFQIVDVTPAADSQTVGDLTEQDILHGVLELATDQVNALLQPVSPSSTPPVVTPPSTDR